MKMVRVQVITTMQADDGTTEDVKVIDVANVDGFGNDGYRYYNRLPAAGVYSGPPIHNFSIKDLKYIAVEPPP